MINVFRATSLKSFPRKSPNTFSAPLLDAIKNEVTSQAQSDLVQKKVETLQSTPRASNWYPGKKSKSGSSGWDPSLINTPTPPSTVKLADKKISTPTPTSYQNFVESQSKYQRTTKPIVTYHPDTPHIFLKYIKRQTPADRMQTLDRSISKISGLDKICLLRSLQMSRYIPESVKVYDVIYKNNIMSRVKYVDHHRQIYLLLDDPIKYKLELLHTWNTMKQFNFQPASHMYTVMMFCCMKWKDIAMGMELYNSLLAQSLQIEVEAFNDIMWLCLHCSKLETARDIWNAHIETINPTFTTIKRGLELFSRFNDTKEINKIYALAESNEVPITKDYENIIQGKRSSNATPYKVALMNAYMAALIECREYDAAKEIFNRMKLEKFSPNKDTFNILINLAYITQDAQQAAEYWKYFKFIDVRPDYITYGKIIEVNGAAGKFDACLSLFNEARTRYSLSPEQKKHQNLETCLIHAFVLGKEYAKAVHVFENMKKNHAFRSTFRYGIAAYCGAGDVGAALDLLKCNSEYFGDDVGEMEEQILAPCSRDLNIHNSN